MQLLWAVYDGELRVFKGICVHAAAPGFFFSVGRRNRSSAVRACCRPAAYADLIIFRAAAGAGQGQGPPQGGGGGG
jgi:hypothetical protein